MKRHLNEGEVEFSVDFGDRKFTTSFSYWNSPTPDVGNGMDPQDVTHYLLNNILVNLNRGDVQVYKLSLTPSAKEGIGNQGCCTLEIIVTLANLLKAKKAIVRRAREVTGRIYTDIFCPGEKR